LGVEKGAKGGDGAVRELEGRVALPLRREDKRGNEPKR